jgi:peptide/nickel transport system substrate-binding protein
MTARPLRVEPRLRPRAFAPRTLLAGVLALVWAVAGLSAAPGTARAAGSSNGSTFITTLDTSVSNFNPFLSFEQGEIDTLDMVYPTLTFGNEQNLPGPWLSTSWSPSANKLSWTFHIRTGLKWSDGVPLTSKDVAWTYNLIMHNSAAATANGTLVAGFKTVTAPNPGTVVITTKQPLANVPEDVMAIPIVPEHIWKSHVKKIGSFTNTTTPVVGYGPYLFTGYQPGQSVTLTANKSFFLGEPKYHKLILDYFANSSAAVAALRSGAIDSTLGLTDTEWRGLQHAPGIKTYQTITNDWYAIEINGHAMTRSGKPIGNGNPLLRNPVIRRAIAIGINRKVLVQKTTGGTGLVTGSYLTPAFPQWYWTPSRSEAQNYDPAKANAMLTRAGFPKGKNGYRYDKKTGKELSFRLGIHSDYPNDSATANYLVGWMKDIGIKLNVQSMSNTQLNDNLAIGDWDILIDQWAEGVDPTYLLSIQTCGVLPLNKNGAGGNTDSFFCNRRYDRLYKAEQTEFNLHKREQDIKAMEKILYDADYDIILYDDSYLWATRTNYLKGYLYGKPNAKGFYPLQNYELGWVKAVPAASTGGGGGLSSTVIIVIIIVAVLLGGGGLLATLRRRRTAEERE